MPTDVTVNLGIRQFLFAKLYLPGFEPRNSWRKSSSLRLNNCISEWFASVVDNDDKTNKGSTLVTVHLFSEKDLRKWRKRLSTKHKALNKRSNRFNRQYRWWRAKAFNFLKSDTIASTFQWRCDKIIHNTFSVSLHSDMIHWVFLLFIYLRSILYQIDCNMTSS